jgi:hypothetical protein
MGEAQDPIAEGLQMSVAGTVGLEGGSMAVMPEAVGLHDEAFLSPLEVDLVAVHPGIYLRQWEAVTAAEPQHHSLELAACPLLVSFEGLA